MKDCPRCGRPLVPLEPVIESGPPAPLVAECERGHQVERLGAASQYGPEQIDPLSLPMSPAMAEWLATIAADDELFLRGTGQGQSLLPGSPGTFTAANGSLGRIYLLDPSAIQDQFVIRGDRDQRA